MSKKQLSVILRKTHQKIPAGLYLLVNGDSGGIPQSLNDKFQAVIWKKIVGRQVVTERLDSGFWNLGS